MVTRSWLLIIGCVAIAIALFAVRPIVTPGPLARDFEAYWAAGRSWNDRADPYGRTIWKAERLVKGVARNRDELLPFIGPPHTIVAWSLAARWRYEDAARVWWGVLGLALLTLVGATLYASRVPIDAVSIVAALILAVAFAPISSDLALGQVAMAAFAGAVLVTVFANRLWPAAALAAVVAFAQPNAALGLVSQLGRNRATLAIVLGALLTYGLGVVVAGWVWPVTYAAAVVQHGLAERFGAIQFDSASVAFDFGATPHEAQLVAAAVTALAVMAALRLAFAVRDAFARFSAFSALVPFVASFFHEHDFVVAFAGVLWCARRTTGTTRAVALAGTLLVGFDWLGLAQRPTGVVQSPLLAAALLLAYVALGPKVRIGHVAVAAVGMAALIAGAAVLAIHNPVPIWPDSLNGFHAGLNASVAAVWHQEQRANGLLAPVPAWGLLRSFSLLGSAMLAYAIYRHSSCYRTA